MMKTSALLFFILVLCGFLSVAQNQDKLQSVNIDEILREIHDGITWGPTNEYGIQIGCATFTNGFGKNLKFDTGTYLFSSNIVQGLLAPPHKHRLKMTCKNESGMMIKLTSCGKALTKKAGFIDKLMLKSNNDLHFLDPSESFRYEINFNLLDTFKIEMPGKYLVSIGTEIYKLDHDGRPRSSTVPPVLYPFVVTQKDLEEHKSNAKAESEPQPMIYPVGMVLLLILFIGYYFSRKSKKLRLRPLP